MTGPARLIPLEGTLNFHDLGGYPTADGRTVAWGRVYRSDRLSELTPAGVAALADLGLTTVCELRGELERQADPDLLVDGIEVVWLPMGEGAGDHGDLVGRVASGELTEIGVDFMVAVYLALLEDYAAQFGQLLRHAADPARHPLVFHCAAGKDRTGLAALLLLCGLGVDEETALDDYELTNAYRSERRIEVLRPQLAERGVDVEAVRVYFSAPRAVMSGALAGLKAAHGSIHGYLTGPAGLTEPDLATLREALLEG